MKKVLKNVWGAILFYAVIVFGVLLLNLRFAYLNNRILNDENTTESKLINK